MAAIIKEPADFEARIRVAGLEHLLPTYRGELASAMTAAVGHASRLVPLPPETEPATVFSLSPAKD